MANTSKQSSGDKKKRKEKNEKTSSKEESNWEYTIQTLDGIYGKCLTGQVEEAIAWYKDQRALITSNKSLNKLSVRRRCRLTPNKDEFKSRELDFVNDAVLTERGRTKYKDIIPPYNASYDSHCKGYFKRPDIKRLVTVTCSPRSPRVS